MRSYEDLSSQGFVEIKMARGTLVSSNPPIDATTAGKICLNSSRSSIALSSIAERLMSTDHAGAASADLRALNYGAAPLAMLPTKIWRRLLSRRCAAADSVTFAPAPEEIFGHRALREQICRYLGQAKALKCSPEEVIVFSDSQSNLDLIARMTINPGDLVAVEDPGYGGARELFQAYGARIYCVPVDGHGLVLEQLYQLEERCKLLYVTPSHQDPTGAVMPLSRRKELLSWAEKHCDFVVEDAFDSDYFYGTNPLPALQGLGSKAKVFYVHSFWKTLFPLVTTGCLVVPPDLVTPFKRAKLCLQRNFSLLEHLALTDFLAEGHMERHILRTRNLYKKRRQALIFALKTVFQSQVAFSQESAGLHMLVCFSLPVAEPTLLALAAEAGLAMVSTSKYYAQSPVALEFLIDFASLDESQTGEIVGRFAKSISANMTA